MASNKSAQMRVLLCGHEQSAEPYIFRKIGDGAAVLTVGVYVDDLSAGGFEKDEELLLESINKGFRTNNLSVPCIIGAVSKEDTGLGTINMWQEVYVEGMTTEFSVQPIPDIPASPGDGLGPTRIDEPAGHRPVREAVRSPLWLSIVTRPDMANAVLVEARRSHTPPRGSGNRSGGFDRT